MDTISEITLVVSQGKSVDRVWKAIDSLLSDWENRFSVEGKKSEITAINNRTHDTVVVSTTAAEMVAQGLAYGDTLNGSFDLTILPLKELWGFGENATGKEPLPTDSAVRETLKNVNYKNVKVYHDSIIFLSKETRIDVGGIAKGFVLRELHTLLETSGFSDYLIVAGGDIVSGGVRPDGKPWRIGIQHPRIRDSVIAVVNIDSGAIVTSGDYERFRIIDGKRYHHIFNSHTGYSCSRNQSVTIYGPDPVECDIFSTGLFCHNASEIIEFVNNRSRLEAVVVDSSGTVFISDRWKETVEMVK
jgi:thiamine biosynthesis lipoprotein